MANSIIHFVDVKHLERFPFTTWRFLYLSSSCSADQICISTSYHQSYWYYWWFLSFGVMVLMISFHSALCEIHKPSRISCWIIVREASSKSWGIEHQICTYKQQRNTHVPQAIWPSSITIIRQNDGLVSTSIWHGIQCRVSLTSIIQRAVYNIPSYFSC